MALTVAVLTAMKVSYHHVKHDHRLRYEQDVVYSGC